MTHGSLFSGIGGFDLAAEWMGWTNVFHCEMNPFGQRVLAHHFPNSKLHEDVKTFPASDYVGRIDCLTGGFPCQPFSHAGKRKGTADDRHLWPQMLDIIRTIKPRWVVGENVLGISSWNGGLVFEEVCSDLELAGYSVQPFVLPAAAVGAPHLRNRVWFVAYAGGTNGKQKIKRGRREQGIERDEVRRYSQSISSERDAAHAEGFCSQRFGDGQRERKFGRSDWSRFPTQSPICGGDDGLPRELDGITFPKWRAESIKAYGNAIVPQVAYQIFKAIQAYEHDQQRGIQEG